MSIYVKAVLSNIGENALCRKNGQFLHKIELLRESTCPIMLKFGLEIALGMIQKSGAAIFEILIFRNFSGGQSQKMANLDQIPLIVILLSMLSPKSYYLPLLVEKDLFLIHITRYCND